MQNQEEAAQGSVGIPISEKKNVVFVFGLVVGWAVMG